MLAAIISFAKFPSDMISKTKKMVKDLEHNAKYTGASEKETPSGNLTGFVVNRTSVASILVDPANG